KKGQLGCKYMLSLSLFRLFINNAPKIDAPSGKHNFLMKILILKALGLPQAVVFLTELTYL
ncbi:MAG: hypothetical protein AAFR05_14210, partial [Bacteroidota bacterium]